MCEYRPPDAVDRVRHHGNLAPARHRPGRFVRSLLVGCLTRCAIPVTVALIGERWITTGVVSLLTGAAITFPSDQGPPSAQEAAERASLLALLYAAKRDLRSTVQYQA